MKKQDNGLIAGIFVLVSLFIVVFAMLSSLRSADAAENVETEMTTEVVEKIIEPLIDSEVVAMEPTGDEQNTYPLLYTDKDAVILAQMLWGEARGVGNLKLSDGRVISRDAQKAACIWTVLNRYDADFKNSIVEVVTAPGQFAGYKASNPVDEGLLEFAHDVLDRWNREKHGEIDVGRVLPSDYYWFQSGGDGHNYFRNEYRSNDYWEWTLDDPYGMTIE